MHLSKSSCSLRDVSSSQQNDGSAKEGRDAVSRRPSYVVSTWAILVCLLVCLAQTAIIVQLRHRIDSQDERVVAIERVLATTGSNEDGHAHASTTQIDAHELNNPSRGRVSRLKRGVRDVAPRDVSSPSSRRTSDDANDRLTRRRRHQKRYVTRDELARALDSLNKIIDEDLHTSFHIVPLLVEFDDKDIATPVRVGPLRWTEHRDTHVTHMTGFELDSDTGQTVEVTVAGTYFVYSQVTYNGRETHTGVAHPPCAHVTMLKPYGRDATGDHKDQVKLLYSVTTQYDRGGRSAHAYDSVFQAGVFHLEPGDRLFVRPDMRSVGCRFVLHPEKTFFGTFRLNPATLKSPYSRRK
ncbi:hypothetical protein NP493_1272g00028 [Ridgeia piscesae]|uniref:THD domain-containing protein n=1 Tax=Ridgeia piscesae TaxID=27915 RepID=A0AAD9K9A3_RIDPI|nr:hypothetical protein NP493_1272g00028 [Ridgeia piscesae]